ncbi:MAG: 4Fe-4S binding protein [Nitrospira bacterium HGW-Nitrospira-1]|nr:MAG: 4Fe-4S binding protein [Nitrospira bacterium HGW-Nitrospira-1]
MLKLEQLNKKRRRLQLYTWPGLPIVIIGGWFYPKLGFFLLGCMLGAITIAFYKGRAWCDWMCPRGSFYDLFIQKISLKREIPSFFRKTGFRVFMLALLLGVLGSQIYILWGDINGIGLAMVRLLTVTTALGIVLGVIYQQRIWCHICPMGTISNYLAEGKNPLRISEQCNAACKLCSKVCPMQLKPCEYKDDGIMRDNDCIKCSTCIAACPKNALQFEKRGI